MERTCISFLEKEKNVLLKGWVYEIRDLSNIKFILLRDFSGIVQCVFKNEKLLKNFSKITLESVLEIKGIVKKANVKAEFARNDIEIEVEEIEILNLAEELPIHVNEKTTKTELDNRLDNRFLDIRKQKIMSIFKIQNVIINSFRNFFYNKKFIEIQPPGIISTSTEGGTDLFEVKYFDKKAYLAQSPQLYKQLCAISFERVFSTGPVWRAEKHDTSKHINEIRQMDIEVAFLDDLQIMKYLEEVFIFIVQEILKNCKKEIKILGLEKEIKIPKAKYLKYSDAIKKLNDNGFKMKIGDDFEPEAERKLCSLFPNTLIFTYEWPSKIKPFYIWPKDKKGNSGGFDALYGGLEISSGGQRVHLPEILINQLKERNLKPENFSWYIDAFRFGAPMHSGWSIGLERITQAILGLENIREATLFTRDKKRLKP